MESQRLESVRETIEAIAGELALAEPGTDQGMLPIYSMLTELIGEFEHEPEALALCQHLVEQFNELFDSAGMLDERLIDRLAAITEALQTAVRFWGMEMEVPWAELHAHLKTPVRTSSAAEDVTSGESVDAATPPVADDLLYLDLKENREILEEFYGEACEHLDSIEAALLDLEQNPDDKDAISSIFRSFHTIKGVAGFLDLRPMQRLAHEVETLLDHVRSGTVAFTSKLINLVLESRDRLQLHLVQIQEGLAKGVQPDVAIPVADLIERTGHFFPGAQEEEDSTNEEDEDDDIPLRSATQPSVAADVGKATAAAQSSAAKAGSSRASIRMDLEKLDSIIDAVGELVIVESLLKDSLSSMGELDSRVERNLAQLGRITGELQRSGLSLRMVSLKPVFQKMQRLVRDLAAKCDKRVNFVMEGEDTEMDRSVVEEIGDPLVHMIRNSLDHGLESVQEREATGKSAVGNLLLRAYYSGDSIVLELKDDGRGINTERVLRKAIERGLADAGQKYTQDEILSFIFLPGFSTAEKITDVSGRGVGMDVVRTNIKKLRGRIELASEQGKGSLVRISLPLTMAIIDGMLVKVGEERFIIPVSNVNMTIKPERGQLFTVQNRGRVVKHRDEIFQLFSLAEFYGLQTAASQADEVVVMVDTEMGIYGLIVDEVIGKQEVVVKQLGGFLSNPEGVAGGAILGDGTVALIIDPSSLQAQSRSR